MPRRRLIPLSIPATCTAALFGCVCMLMLGACAAADVQARTDRYADLIAHSAATLERVAAATQTEPGVVYRSQPAQEAQAIAEAAKTMQAAAGIVAEAATRSAAAAQSAADSAATIPEKIAAAAATVAPLAGAATTIATGNPAAGAAVNGSITEIGTALAKALAYAAAGAAAVGGAWKASNRAWDDAKADTVKPQGSAR